MKLKIISNNRQKANKPTVLIFAKSLDGGTGTFVLDLQDINKVYPSKLIIKTLALEKPRYRNIQNYKIEYFTTDSYYPESYSISFQNIRNLIKEMVWFNIKLRRIKPDVIITVDSHCLILAELSKLLSMNNVKTIATIHNNLSEIIYIKSSKTLYSIITKLLSFLLNKADIVVCVSKQLSNDLKKNFHLMNTPVTQYNGLPLSKLKKPRLLKKGKKIIISIARFVEQKDHKTLIAAFHKVHKKHPNTNLWIVGDGPLKRDIKKQVKDMRLTNSVKFLGWLQDLEKVLSRADIFVLSSNREGFGYVLIEAMSHGLPVVSTNSPYGPLETLGKGRYGILTPVGNPDMLSNAIIKLISSKSTYYHYSKLAIQRAGYFSKEKMLKGYRKLITKTLN